MVSEVKPSNATLNQTEPLANSFPLRVLGRTFLILGLFTSTLFYAQSVNNTSNTGVNRAKPSITTNATKQIKHNKATLNANITYGGTTTITQKGFIYSKGTATPTIAGVGTTAIKRVVSGTAIGRYSATITGLSPNTVYKVMAFVTNSAGTTTGTIKNFTTIANEAPTFTSTPIVTVIKGQTYSYTLATNDSNGNQLIFNAVTKPSWLNLSTFVSTIAGTGATGSDDGAVASATFSNFRGITIDTSGNLYVADTGNGKIRKITPSGMVSTVASGFDRPCGIVIDATGNIYVADTWNHQIKKITPSGDLITLTGMGITGFDAKTKRKGFADGSSSLAKFEYPSAIAVDVSGNLYITDRGSGKIRKLTPSGEVSTVASGFKRPGGITIDASGNLYVADTRSNQIKKITLPSGSVNTVTVSVVAGEGISDFKDGLGTFAEFWSPSGIILDTFGNIYVGDLQNHRIRKITPSGMVSTIAGSGGIAFVSPPNFADGVGTSAKFRYPHGITIDALGNLYVADVNNRRIRKITQSNYLQGTAPTITGTHKVVLTATDVYGGTVTQTFTLNVIDKPIVTTNATTLVKHNKATLNANITANNYGTITEKGFIYSKATITPTIADVNGTTVIKRVVSGTAIGTYSATVTDLEFNTEYKAMAYAINEAGTTTGSIISFTTNILTPTLTFAPISKTYGDANFNLNASSASSGTISYSIVEGVGSATLSGANNQTLTIKKTGTVIVKATQIADGVYGRGTKTTTLTIAKKALIVTAETKTKTYDGAIFPTENYSVRYNGLVNSETSSVLDGTVSYTGTSQTAKNVGTYTITPNGLTSDNYNITYSDGSLTINKTDIIGISFENKPFSYDGTAKSLAITGTLPNGTSVSYANNGKTNVGTYGVTATINGGANYNNKVLTANLTINKADITGVTFENKSFSYDGTAKSLTITEALPSGTSVSYANNGKTNVGTYGVTATIDGGANYNNKVLTANLTINKADITGITFENKSFSYDGTAKSLVITGTLPNGTSVSYINNGKTSVGTYGVTATIDGGENYNNKVLTANLTINKTDITGITFENKSFSYDGTAKSLAITGTLPNGTSVSYINNGKTSVGTYGVTATIDGGANYNNKVLTAKLTIEPQGVVVKNDIVGITFENKSFSYDGTVKSLAITGTLPNGTSVSYANNGKTDAGTYTVTATIDGGANYNNKVLTANLTINKADITGISFENKSFSYDGTAKSLVITGTLPNGTSVSYANHGKTNVGTYGVTATIDGGANYNNKVLTANLTINKTDITGITFENKSFSYDGTAKSLAVTGTLPNGTSVSYANNGKTNAGTYTVTAIIDGGTNYNNLTLKASLTIKSNIAGDINNNGKIDGNEIAGDVNGNGKIDENEIYGDVNGNGKLDKGESKKPQSITWNEELFIECDYHTIMELEATSDSGLPITYTVEDTSIAVIEGNMIRFITDGVAKVTASQNGNNIYEAATSITKNISKTQTDLIIQHWEDMLIFDNSSGEYVFWQWYKNGEAIEGAVEQFYKSAILVGNYYVIAQTKDGKEVRTCSVEVNGAKTLTKRGIKLGQNPVTRGSNFTVEVHYSKQELSKKVVLAMYDLTGKLLQSKKVSSTKETLVAPSSAGIYIVRLLLANGRQESINVLVN